MIWGAIRRCFVTETIAGVIVLLVGSLLAALGLVKPSPTYLALAAIVGLCAMLYSRRYKRL